MQRELRWGAEFGSGKLITPKVWELLGDPGGLYELAMAEAWFNGCKKPEHNISENGPRQNAEGDGRHNFLYGYILAHANLRLLDNLQTLQEPIPEGTPIETQHVPDSYRIGGVRTGLARDSLYEIVSGLWKQVDARIADGLGEQDAFLSMLNSLDPALKKATSEEEFHSRFI